MAFSVGSELKKVNFDLSKASPVGFVTDKGNLTTVPLWRSICSIRPWELSATAMKFDLSTSESKIKNFEDQMNIIVPLLTIVGQIYN